MASSWQSSGWRNKGTRTIDEVIEKIEREAREGVVVGEREGAIVIERKGAIAREREGAVIRERESERA